jgi:hypothetical protein
LPVEKSLRRSILLAALLFAVPVGAGAQSAIQPATTAGVQAAFTAQGEELLQKLTAQQFDGRLPAVGLKPWLTGLLGKLAQIDWSTADCGDEGGGPDPSTGQGNADQGGQPPGSSDSDLDSPLCTGALAQFYGRDGRPSLDRYVVVQLLVGTDGSGVHRDASSYGPPAVSVFVFDGSAVRTLSRLGDLPTALAAMK